MEKVGSRRRKTWIPDKEGRYARQLGWKRNEQGKLVQHKFYLGVDERQAERRNHKLEELWDRVEELWGQIIHLPGNDQPIWENLTLNIGKRLAKGECEFTVPYAYEDPADYARKIHTLNKWYPMIRFVPEDHGRYESGAEFTKGLVDNEIASILSVAELFGNLPNKPVVPAGDGTLHQALDDYIEWLKVDQREPGTDRIKTWGWTQIREVERLKEKHQDMSLSSLDLEAIESMIRVWRSRPNVKGKPLQAGPIRRQRQVQVSLAFWRDEARAAYDPCAPTVEERKEGIRALRAVGIPVILRIDPLFPRSPLPIQASSLRDFGLTEAQTLNDLEHLVAFARDVGVRHVVYSTAKIVQPRGRPVMTVAAKRAVRALCAPGKPVWRDFSWRLPPEIAERHIIQPFREICRRAGIAGKFCMRDLVEIP